ncbi:hypothetical protein NV379_02490 [Paenibacillus sp. N1-5-1-14]|uniref:hypothetical protein n=1 Tax=Paenibacillus radicibacter TaxID=2972488 RepID=UPI00215957B8|nr:hypothetical protein [Paenibacillus radicibacter]MCR8641515.1 hypothetical protein [Paenibacillus radicibacter]
MTWEFTKTMIVGYGKLTDSKGKEYNVDFDQNGNIEVTTIKQNKPVKIPNKVHQMILQKIR